MKSEQTAKVRRACAEFLKIASQFYQVPDCSVRVLTLDRCEPASNGRPSYSVTVTQKPMLIRIWMRTAVRKEITSFGTFLSTLCHEFCRHLDYKKFGFADSWHTRGFYERAGVLYHMRGVRRRSTCFGRQCRASAGVLIGQRPIEAHTISKDAAGASNPVKGSKEGRHAE